MERCSEAQRMILTFLLRETLAMEASRHDADRIAVSTWGIRWSPKSWGGSWSPALRASVSRALRRLADRGLVDRLNQVSGTRDQTVKGDEARPGWVGDDEDYPSSFRTTHVRLTAAGRALAERLTDSQRSC